MLKRFFPLIFLTLLFTGLVFPQRTIDGTVSEVLDGQTIKVTTNRGNDFLVQLRLIETPAEDQPLYDVVKDHLSKLILGKSVSFQFAGTDGDTYISQVALGEIDVSMQMLRDGAAWYSVEGQSQPSTDVDANYRSVENLAKTEHRGIWGINGLKPPLFIRKKTVASANPLKDPEVANLAWGSLGSSVEGVFGQEVYTSITGNCGGSVIDIIDGDTVKILNSNNEQVTVRLEGIDAPEKSQAFGMAAKAYLSSQIYGKTVSCESTKRDRYGRLIGKILLNGVDINLAMIRGGYAWHYKEYEMEQSISDRTLYAQAEISARNSHSGLWQDSNPIKPSDYRRDRFFAIYRNPSESTTRFFYNGSSYSPSYGSGLSNGPVRVRSYTRSDGTFVRSHTRSRPN